MEIINSLISHDKKVIKYLQQTKDKHIIETGYYNLDENIICISSQIGCPMSCVFCATNATINSQNFIRNLTAEEIVQQVKNILNIIGKNKRKVLFSYMGMGEPFLNYKNVVKSIKILKKEFPNSRTTIATTGINPDLIKKLAHEKFKTLVKLHLSLHAASNTLRKKILPKTKSIKLALKALEYFSMIKDIPSKINYILIKNVNDSKNDALKLAKLLKFYPFVVKLSNLNNFRKYKPSPINKFRLFKKILSSHNIKTCRFFSIGTDIQAGCGQLRRYHYFNH